MNLLSYATQLHKATRTDEEVDLDTSVQDIVSETQALTYGSKTVVDWCNDEAIANPDESGARQCYSSVR